ncbi:MAG TPA: HIT family protein [Candidatus Nanoarchaeia archaeon]|nr:HIT family protein [Candidatus Nanoarchaeia archaeon]
MPTKLSKEEVEQIQEYLQTLPEDIREEKLKEILEKYESSPQCPFCLMAEEKIQTTKVYEDADYLGVLEINPANPGHIILFTKTHYSTLASLPVNDVENLFKIAKVLAHALSTFNDGISLFTEDGNITGKRFDHFIINIIPRKKNDDVNLMTKPKTSSPDKLNEMREKILSNLPKEEKKQEEKPSSADSESAFLRSFERLKKRKP